MEESQRNIEIITKTIICGVIYIILSMMIMFFIGVYKVEAKTYQGNGYKVELKLPNGGTTNICQDVQGRLNYFCPETLYTGDGYPSQANIYYDISASPLIIDNKYKIIWEGQIILKDHITENLETNIGTSIFVGTSKTSNRTQVSADSNYAYDVQYIGTEKYWDSTNGTTSLQRTGYKYKVIISMEITSRNNNWTYMDIIVYDGQRFAGIMGVKLEIVDANDPNSSVIENNNANTDKIIMNDNQNTDKITEAITGSGLDTETTKPADKEDYQNTHEKEENLLEEWKPTDEELGNVELEIEQEPANYMWSLLERILNTNERILYLVMSILVVGIIKLIMGR